MIIIILTCYLSTSFINCEQFTKVVVVVVVVVVVEDAIFGWALRYSHAIELTLFLWHICQLIPLKLWPNTAQGCNHQSVFMPQLLWCSAALVPMYYPGGMKARVRPLQWSKPYSLLAPTQGSNPGGLIQNHKRWPLHTHCTKVQVVSSIRTSPYPSHLTRSYPHAVRREVIIIIIIIIIIFFFAPGTNDPWRSTK